MNQRLRSLIKLLGEAIHESVSESEHISEVVEDIRKQGFDVLLMLEATIGLNEVEDQPASLGDGREKGSAAIEPKDKKRRFTSQDVHFLRTLRICVEEENGREPAP